MGRTGAPKGAGESAKRSHDDVVPEWFTRALMILWIALLGGRWLATPFIMFGDPEAAEAVSYWDRNYLLKLYLILLVVTLIVLALRFGRSLDRNSRPRN